MGLNNRAEIGTRYYRNENNFVQNIADHCVYTRETKKSECDLDNNHHLKKI